MANNHTFFCIDLDCEKEVKEYGMACEDHETDTTSECPGCGMELYVGANGYCSHCWVERFGCEEDPVPCSGRASCTCYGCEKCWQEACDEQASLPVELPPAADDLTTAQCRVCNETFLQRDGIAGSWMCNMCFKHSMPHNQIGGRCDGTRESCWCLSVAKRIAKMEHKCSGEWDYDRGHLVCDDHDDEACPQHVPNPFKVAPCACRNSPMCKACERANGYGEWDDHYDGSTYDCQNCKREFKNKYWRNQLLCRDCEELPPLPPSPKDEIENLRDQIAAIKEKVELYSRGMTAAQVDDWRHLWMLKELRLKALGVDVDDRENRWEDYDADDLRKLDLQLRR